MPRRTRQISLPPDADRILAAVGNASQYVAEIVVEHDRDWRSSLDVLRAAGLSRAQIRAACSTGEIDGRPIVRRAAATLARECRAGNAALEDRL